MPRWLQKILRYEPGVSLGQWVYERIANNWPRIVALLGVGGGMTYAAAVTDWLVEWGPVAWGAIGILSFCVVTFFMWLLSVARHRIAMARLLSKRIESDSIINPLASFFKEQKINLSDFYYPKPIPHDKKTFEDCHIHGPGAMAIGGGSRLFMPEIIVGDIICVREGINSVCPFLDSTFTRCKFFDVTLLVSPDIASLIEADITRQGGPIPLIHGYNEERWRAAQSGGQS